MSETMNQIVKVCVAYVKFSASTIKNASRFNGENDESRATSPPLEGITSYLMPLTVDIVDSYCIVHIQ